jgi:hypothetical protein
MAFVRTARRADDFYFAEPLFVYAGVRLARGLALKQNP